MGLENGIMRWRPSTASAHGEGFVAAGRVQVRECTGLEVIDLQLFMKEYDKAMATYEAGLKHEPDNVELKGGIMRCLQAIDRIAHGENITMSSIRCGGVRIVDARGCLYI
jgi:hypothetical protein